MTKKLSVILSLILFLSTLPAYAKNNIVLEKIKETGGVTLGITISPVIGMTRGFSKGLIIGTDFTSRQLGDKNGSVHRMIGLITGGIFTGTCGLCAGFLKGIYEGVKYGIEDPFSKENLSLGGTSFTDYNLL